tara:strand:- start:475 stop:684 length:210 start_codon:yes stop_codon:yes gene_type:complete
MDIIISFAIIIGLVYLCDYVRNQIHDIQQTQSMIQGIEVFSGLGGIQELEDEGDGADDIPIEWFMWSDL